MVSYTLLYMQQCIFLFVTGSHGENKKLSQVKDAMQKKFHCLVYQLVNVATSWLYVHCHLKPHLEHFISYTMQKIYSYKHLNIR